MEVEQVVEQASTLSTGVQRLDYRAWLSRAHAVEPVHSSAPLVIVLR